jgi:hypothetical protein
MASCRSLWIGGWRLGMLDLLYLAIGSGVLALFGLYALGLRRI